MAEIHFQFTKLSQKKSFRLDVNQHFIRFSSHQSKEIFPGEKFFSFGLRPLSLIKDIKSELSSKKVAVRHWTILCYRIIGSSVLSFGYTLRPNVKLNQLTFFSFLSLKSSWKLKILFRMLSMKSILGNLDFDLQKYSKFDLLNLFNRFFNRKLWYLFWREVK